MSGLNTMSLTWISAAHAHRAAVHTKVEQSRGIELVTSAQGAAYLSEQNVPEVGNACKVTNK